MKLFQHKPLDLGFVIICYDSSVSNLRVSVNSIKKQYGVPCIAVVGNEINPKDFEEMSKLCPVYKGNGTITSLINAGMTFPPAEWNMTMMAGTWLRKNLDKKYSLFVESERDILYAIVNSFYEFPDCSMNGIMIHRETWKLVGNFCEKAPLGVCKLIWALTATNNGCRLKAIAGARMI